MTQDARRSAAMGVAAAVAACAVALTGASAAAAVSAGTWGKAIEIPGTATLNQGAAQVNSVSCASAGNCSAGGTYTDSTGHSQAFVASEVNGTWQRAIEVPGTGPLNQGGSAYVDSVSCGSAGNCSAGGGYTDSTGREQSFVASEVNGTWHTAIEVPGTATLNQGVGYAYADSVSCRSAGNCSAGGTYADSSSVNQAFVVSEVNGTWQRAIEVPGTGPLNQGGSAYVDSVSCGSAGNCSAAGTYLDSSSYLQAFVASEVNGTWHTAIEIPGTAPLNQGGYAPVRSVSCPSAGNCSVGGSYSDGTHEQAFAAGEVSGTWHTAIEVPGTAALNQGGSAQVDSVSCASAGNCSAGGTYTDSTSRQQVFAASEVNGTWHTAIEIPGTGPLNQGGTARVFSLSCPSAGNCTVGGSYTGSTGHFQAFVASEVNGTWRRAIELPGTATLNRGGWAEVDSLSCPSAGNCSAGGTYTDSSGSFQAFVANET